MFESKSYDTTDVIDLFYLCTKGRRDYQMAPKLTISQRLDRYNSATSGRIELVTNDNDNAWP